MVNRGKRKKEIISPVKNIISSLITELHTTEHLEQSMIVKILYFIRESYNDINGSFLPLYAMFLT